MSGAYCPRTLGPSVVVFSRAESLRVDRYVASVGGQRVARARLGVGEHTLDSALDQGRMLGKTKARFLDALTREEALVP